MHLLSELEFLERNRTSLLSMNESEAKSYHKDGNVCLHITIDLEGDLWLRGIHLTHFSLISESDANVNNAT